MKTPFYSHVTFGKVLIIAGIPLILNCIVANMSFGQMGTYTIEGESLWRNQGYGVSNHQFDIETYCLCNSQNYPLNPDPVTDDCPYEIYTTDIMPLHDTDEDAAYNTLKLRPYSVNNASDYRNGVSTLDLVAINTHLLNDPPFEERNPTEDAPFRYISGDADNDMDVDEDDIDMIHDLILFNRDDLERDSWEWVHKDEIENAEERFVEVPYEFVISYNWEGPDGIILPALTTNEIEADNDKFFTFRTTKIGDIMAASGQLDASTNSWICGSGSYFTNDEIETRTIFPTREKKIRSGSIITGAVYLDVEEDVYAIELPVFVDNNIFDFIDIDFKEGFTPRWNYNTDYSILVISDFSRDLRPLHELNGKLLEFKLRVEKDIQIVQESLSWSINRMVEVIGNEGVLIYTAKPRLEIVDILPPDLYLETRYDMDIPNAYIESPKDQQVIIQFFNIQGFMIESEERMIYKGENYVPLKVKLVPGLYIIRVISEKQELVDMVRIH